MDQIRDTIEKYTDIRLRQKIRRAANKSDALVLFEASGDPVVIDFKRNRDGGPGSGNWGHEGRPGEIGGSKDGGGSHNRLEDEDGSYTSFSKKKKKYATPHKTSIDEIKKAPAGTKLIFDGEVFTKVEFGYINVATGQHRSHVGIFKQCDGKDVSFAIPDSENKNYRKITNSNTSDNDERFSAKRKSKAAKFTDYREADNTFREETGRIWRECTGDEKEAINQYTGSGYRTYNGILRGTKSYLDSDENRKLIDHMTDVIERAEMKQDTWLVRGVDIAGAEKLFGLEEGTFANRNPKEMIGITGTDKGFVSCGTKVGTGFNDDVKISIYCPAGTKAIYAEPFSKMGRGSGINWDEENEDGVSKQSSFSSEFETILQRGTTFQVTGYKSSYGTVELEVQVVSQNTD